jgi:hypothetical protein
MCTRIFLLLAHEAQGPKSCRNSSRFLHPLFPGSPTSSYALKFIVHHLFGNSLLGDAFHVVFTFLSVFANNIIQTFQAQFIPENIIVVPITDLKNRDLAA